MTKNYISLGAGVQSSTLSLMAAHGEIWPMPDGAIFSDTGAEPSAVYTWLDWLEKQLPFPVYRVRKSNLADDLIANTNSDGGKFAAVPFYFEGGMGRRQCTKEYKLRPLQRKVRDLGALTKSPFTVWIGISTDEAHRMKPSHVKYITNRWPLIERGISRDDCLDWMQMHGYGCPPKSACVFCPYSKDAQFKALKIAGGDDWKLAVQVDAAANLRGQFVHRQKVPLSLVDFRSAEEAGQMNMFGNECEGMCGV